MEIYRQNNKFGNLITYKIQCESDKNMLVIHIHKLLFFRYGENFVEPEGGPYISKNYEFTGHDKVQYKVIRIVEILQNRYFNNISISEDNSENLPDEKTLPIKYIDLYLKCEYKIVQ